LECGCSRWIGDPTLLARRARGPQATALGGGAVAVRECVFDFWWPGDEGGDDAGQRDPGQEA